MVASGAGNNDAAAARALAGSPPEAHPPNPATATTVAATPAAGTGTDTDGAAGDASGTQMMAQVRVTRCAVATLSSRPRLLPAMGLGAELNAPGFTAGAPFIATPPLV